MPLISTLLDTFRFDGEPIGRARYVVTGVVLAAIKYGVEAAVIGVVTGRGYGPADFLNPLLRGRADFLAGGPEWLGMAWLFWTLPFVVVAISLNLRRAVDTGGSPWLTLWTLVPVANLVLITVLAMRPTRGPRQPLLVEAEARSVSLGSAWRAALLAVLVGVLYTLAVSVTCVYLLGDYGAALFYGAPAVVGVAAGYLLNAREPCSPGGTLGHAALTTLLAMGAMLVLAFEGVICLVMALPLMLPMALIGALLGREIARLRHRPEADQRGLAGALLLLPLMGTIESRLPEPPERLVETSVVVDAPPQRVWDAVIAFPPIDAPEPWYFRLGIASPQSARLEGRGVGAVRYCVFTTGEFVEPITAWDAPRRLAFDVAEQPEPMFELTPYREIHPPHLEGALESTRGEFRLEPLEGGKTRLTGRTWYRLRMAPAAYWTVWTDAILHRIHRRVLDHIGLVSEEG